MDSYTLILSALLLSAFFSGMEIAFINSNKLKIELNKNKGMASARLISDFTKKPSHFLSAMMVGNVIALVMYGVAIANKLDPFLRQNLSASLNNDVSIFLLQTFLTTLLILIVAELLPRILFRISSNALVTFFAIPISVFYYLFFPITLIFNGVSEFILKYIFRIKVSGKEHEFSTVDLDNYVRELDNKQLDDSEVRQEIQMIQNAMEFHNVKLRECMVPRNEIVAIEENDPVEELASEMAETGLSRILVYRDSIDNIIGYVHSFDLFSKPQSIQPLIKPIIIAPETMTANKILTTFIQQHKSIALVVDEFGGTSGIVTMEDIIEEIFGEIDDEYDKEEKTEKQVSDNEFIFSGRHEIDYLNGKYMMELPESDDYETLAGLILHYHEDIPAIGEEIQIGKFAFIILQATNTLIQQVQLKILDGS
ncbi:MAG: HlyC/CorC family transporter [Bacteroidales bacterium]|nr:HlyC/CorC family transporter [Bacteroidales bacterium]